MLEILERMLEEANDFEDFDVNIWSQSETRLSNVTAEQLDEICEFMDEHGIDYWLYDEPRVNPEATYDLWISGEQRYARQPSFRWGFRRVEVDSAD